MEEKTWYLGPLGDLREFVTPEPGLGASHIEYGGMHQGLSGARTKDFTGSKTEYKFEIRNLDPTEYRFLEAMKTRLIPGPFYLIDPMKKNRLSVTACRMTRPLTEYPSMTYALAYDRPADIDMPVRSMQIKSWASYPISIPIRWERNNVTPVFPNETVSASVYVKASAAANGRLYFDYIGPQGNVVSQYYEAKTAVTSWQRISFTRQIPADVAGVRFYFQTLSPRTELFFAAPQVESGSTVTPWEIGGGGNTVLMDSLEVTSPRYPLRNAEMTLLEA